MYSFEHKDTEHPMRDMRNILEDTAHRAKDCLEHLLDEPCWDSQDLDDVKDCTHGYSYASQCVRYCEHP